MSTFGQSLAPYSRAVVIGVALLVVVGTVPGLTAAQETRAGGVVVVGPDERVGSLEVTAGTVVVEGVVDGDLTATAGSVVVTGTVTGDLTATAGSITVEGDVGGAVGAVGGAVLVREGASVGGGLEAAAGDVRIDGMVGGDAVVAADSMTVGPAADIGGELRHDTRSISVAPAAAVGGGVRAVDNPEFTTLAGIGSRFADGPGFTVPPWVGAVYGFLANLLLGVLLLAVAPAFGRRVAGLGRTRTLRSGGAGLLVFVATPVALALLAVTIVGLPLSLAGLAAFLLVLWTAGVYGAYVVGAWLLAYADEANRWLALVVGLVVVAVVGVVPVLGALAQFVILLVGLGALALALRGESGAGEQPSAATGEGRTAT